MRETMVVDPEQVRVLDSTGSPSLTLITCYPFNYVHRPGDPGDELTDLMGSGSTSFHIDSSAT
jgi:LPXTG-site transpeptidase (sortase) family protein